MLYPHVATVVKAGQSMFQAGHSFRLHKIHLQSQSSVFGIVLYPEDTEVRRSVPRDLSNVVSVDMFSPHNFDLWS